MDRNDIALNRFGLGARPGERIGDPAGWLREQMSRYRPALNGSAALTSRGGVVRAIAQLQRAVLEGREKPGDKAAAQRGDDALKAFQGKVRSIYQEQVGLRARAAIASETPFIERLVHFWSNHFAVSQEKMGPNGLAGLFEMEAIRPHVLGRFEDMLVAVEQHPAMLMYLDQIYSTGPNSKTGAAAARQGGARGLNENLAREILELHTLGAGSGYNQGDVTEFARVLTGWNVAGLGRGAPTQLALKAGVPQGDFLFIDDWHEPGARTVLGKSYAQPGVAQGRAVLADLARHPATARHVATKLARHFGGDDPPPALVARLEKAYRTSGGDLRVVHGALIEAPEVWASAPLKFRTPWEWVIASYRAVKLPIDLSEHPGKAGAGFSNLLIQLGQPVWKPGSPAGYDDVAASWAGPDALIRRVEAASQLSGKTSPATDTRALAREIFGARLSQTTADVIAAAGDPRQGTALLLVAPEMMRR